MLGIFLQPESYTAPTVTVASEFNLWYFKYYSFLGVHQKNNHPSHSCFLPSSSIVTTIHKSLIDQFLSLLFPRIFICFFLDQANPFCVRNKLIQFLQRQVWLWQWHQNSESDWEINCQTLEEEEKKTQVITFLSGFPNDEFKNDTSEKILVYFYLFKNRLIVP